MSRFGNAVKMDSEKVCETIFNYCPFAIEYVNMRNSFFLVYLFLVTPGYPWLLLVTPGYSWLTDV